MMMVGNWKGKISCGVAIFFSISPCKEDKVNTMTLKDMCIEMFKRMFSLILIFTVMSALFGCSYQKQPRSHIQWDWIEKRISKKILVVPLSFPGTLFGNDMEKIKLRYAVKLPEYIRDLSYGQEHVDVEVTSWMEMPNPISHYRLSSWRLKAWRYQDHKKRFILVRDAAELIEKNYDLDAYDGLMLVAGTCFRDFGRHGYVARWLSGFFKITTRKGTQVPPTDVHIQDCPLPSLAYALVKILTGYKGEISVAPTLYDYQAQSSPGKYGYANAYHGRPGGHAYCSIYVGPWDILSQHGIKTMQGYMPQGMTSFTKLRSGWIRPEQVIRVERGEKRQVLLGPLWRANEQALVVYLPVNEHLYYLIENRQQRGVDQYLPSEGVLILQVDERIEESKGPVRIVDGHPHVPYFGEAPFKAGERYENPHHRLAVSILQKNADRYLIEIVRSEGGSPP